MVKLPWGANESPFQKRRIELSNANADPITLEQIQFMRMYCITKLVGFNCEINF